MYKDNVILYKGERSEGLYGIIDGEIEIIDYTMKEHIVNYNKNNYKNNVGFKKNNSIMEVVIKETNKKINNLRRTSYILNNLNNSNTNTDNIDNQNLNSENTNNCLLSNINNINKIDNGLNIKNKQYIDTKGAFSCLDLQLNNLSFIDIKTNNISNNDLNINNYKCMSTVDLEMIRYNRSVLSVQKSAESITNNNEFVKLLKLKNKINKNIIAYNEKSKDCPYNLDYYNTISINTLTEGECFGHKELINKQKLEYSYIVKSDKVRLFRITEKHFKENYFVSNTS